MRAWGAGCGICDMWCEMGGLVLKGGFLDAGIGMEKGGSQDFLLHIAGGLVYIGSR
jgi:hypothetical protein